MRRRVRSGLLPPPILSRGYGEIAAKSGRLFHSGDTAGDTFCQGRVPGLEGDMSKSKKGRSSAGFWLLLGGLLLVNEESLRSIEKNADDFVIRLAIFLALIAVAIAVAVWG